MDFNSLSIVADGHAEAALALERLSEQYPAADAEQARPVHGARARERLLFEALAVAPDDTISRQALPRALESCGLLQDDPRLSESLAFENI